MTMEIELAKQNGIQYRLTPEGTTEMWCHDRDVQAFAEAVRAAACAERSARIAELEHQLAEARKDAERYRWLRNEHWENNRLGVVLRPKDQTKLGTFIPSGSLLDDTIDHMSGKDEYP